MRLASALSASLLSFPVAVIRLSGSIHRERLLFPSVSLSIAWISARELPSEWKKFQGRPLCTVVASRAVCARASLPVFMYIIAYSTYLCSLYENSRCVYICVYIYIHNTPSDELSARGMRVPIAFNPARGRETAGDLIYKWRIFFFSATARARSLVIVRDLWFLRPAKLRRVRLLWRGVMSW